jgi:hypothetical protein
VEKRTAKLGVSNGRATPHVIWVEPWANDYTLMPGEELTIEATGGQLFPPLPRDIQPSFVVVETEGGTQVYCNDTVDFRVTKNDGELECGHQRQPGTG